MEDGLFQSIRQRTEASERLQDDILGEMTAQLKSRAWGVISESGGSSREDQYHIKGTAGQFKDK